MSAPHHPTPDGVILVTGGSRGIGQALVQRLLDDGHRVATCSRQPSAAVQAWQAGPSAARFFWQPCTVGEAAAEQRLVEAVTAWAGEVGLWGLVNNAAIAGEGVLATFPNVDSARILETDLLGALRLARLVLRVLLRQPPGGRIVNVSSIVGLRGFTGLTAYAAAKAGMDGLTRALAREVGRRQITVNSVAPGYVATELSSGLSAARRQQIVGRTPLGRLAEASDVVAVIAFLLRPEAGFVTGQTLVVDGGLTC